MLPQYLIKFLNGLKTIPQERKAELPTSIADTKSPTTLPTATTVPTDPFESETERRKIHNETQ